MSKKSISAWECHVDTSFIGNLYPINRLSQRSRARLLKKAQIQNYLHDGCINSDKEEHWITYLLEGDYIIESKITPLTRKPESYKDGFQRPVFTRNTESKITFKVRSKIIRFDRSLYEILLQEDQTEKSKFNDVEMTDHERNIFFKIFEACKHRNPEIISLASSALNIQEQIDDCQHNIDLLTSLTGSDPIFAGNVLSEANSDRFIGMPKITSLRQSLERLDSSELRNILDSYAGSALFEDDNSLTTSLAHEIYSHSICIAVWCAELAKKSQRIDKDEAFAAGLLHNIGKLLALKYARDNESLANNKDELTALVEKLQPLVSPMILSKWGLDQEFINAAEEGHNFARFSSSNGDYCDVVIIAHWCNQLCNGEKSKLPAMHDVAAFRKLGLEYMNSKQINKIFKEVGSQCQNICNCSGLSKAS